MPDLTAAVLFGVSDKTQSPRRIYLGCAGWAIPKAHALRFPPTGSVLKRYAARFSAVEINSSFYKTHKPGTYAKWAGLVPQSFRFSVKLSKQITHIGKLRETAMLDDFLTGVRCLGDKLGPLLVQLPPRLTFDRAVARGFFAGLRKKFGGEVVCEPRHPSWFEQEIDELLSEFEVARAIADPARIPEGKNPGGWRGLVYIRLHGSPRMYYSSYPPAFLDDLAHRLREWSASATVWCIFDNTASGAAAENALGILDRLGLE